MPNIGQSQYSILAGDRHRIARQSSQFQKLSHQLATGKRHQSLREYGINVSRIIDLQGVIDRRESYLRAISLVEFNVEAYQNILAEMDDLATQARKLSRDAPPNANSGTDLRAWRSSVDTTATLLLRQMTEILNTNIGGRYIFSGDNFKSPATIDLTTLQTFSATDAADPRLLQQQNRDSLPQGSVRFEATATPQVNIAPGVDVDQGGATQTQQITIQVDGDITPEQALERFKLEIGPATPRDSNHTASTIVENSAMGYVADDDPVISIHNLGVNEVEEGNNVVFAIRRKGGQQPTAATPITVPIGTHPAALPTGYTLTGAGGAALTSVTFDNTAPDEILVTLTAPLVADTTINDNQRIGLQLSAPTAGNAIIDSAQASADATINDNDDPNVEYVTITADAATSPSVLPAAQTEGTAHVFTITRHNPGTDAESKTVSWRIDEENSTTDAADFGGTYPSGQVTFNAGETTKKITVHLADDGRLEGEERFQVQVTGEQVIQSRAEGIITDNDASYAIRAVDVAKREGSTQGHVFLVTRQGDTSVAGTVDVNLDTATSGVTADATTGDGLSFSDTAIDTAAQTVTFAAGETERLVTVYTDITAGGRVLDTTVEDDEVFQLSLSNPAGSTNNRIDALAGVARGTIVGDDFAKLTNTIEVSAAVTPATAPAEGNQGARTNIVFTVTRTQATVATPAQGVTAPPLEEEFITYSVIDNAADPASSNSHDFAEGYGVVPYFTATDENGAAVDQTYLFGKVVGERDPGFWAQQQTSLRDGENRTYGISAADPTFQKLIKALVLLKSSAEERNESAVRDMLAKAERMTREAVSEIRSMTSDNAVDVNGIAAAKKTHEMFNALAKSKLSDITDIDTAEAATVLTGLQTQVNASYTLISKRAQLSLANFL